MTRSTESLPCPHCGNLTNEVTDSRPNPEKHHIKRRRKCLACAQRFTTYEGVGFVEQAAADPHDLNELHTSISTVIRVGEKALAKIEDILA